jgi:hypothetical protein
MEWSGVEWGGVEWGGVGWSVGGDGEGGVEGGEGEWRDGGEWGECGAYMQADESVVCVMVHQRWASEGDGREGDESVGYWWIVGGTERIVG